MRCAEAASSPALRYCFKASRNPVKNTTAHPRPGVKSRPQLPETSTRAILESISDGVFTVDLNWRITSFNRAAEEITGTPREEALGSLCSDVFRAGMCENACALRRTLLTGKPIINRSTYIVNAEGRRLPISVSTAVLRDESGRIAGGAETFRDLSEVEELRKELEGRFQLGDMVSRSPRMQEIFRLLPAVAASESTVLIQGETGTGKELLARAVHELSPRRNGPFVAVNCGALPDTLLESELFGYRTGAFTGADRDKPGRFALAQGGTVFLDEIGEISPALQVRLLRVLQEKTIEPLGATAPQPVDARVIAATNRDLKERVRLGEFRADLFYRIHVVPLTLPPLRERKEDVPLLCDVLVQRLNRIQGRNIQGVAPDALAALMDYDFPGNVRELENILEHAFVLCDGTRIELQHLPAEFRADPARAAAAAGAPLNFLEAESRVIREALARHGGNRAATAQALGIHKTTLYRKMKRLGILPSATDGRSRSSRKGA